ncbi:MAG: hypothetical protein NTW95_14100 [Candidatus Aminicenantes bacterium]|nr:hypothetical protein [Candidatus Aminicenantes bacterium]
MIKKSKKLLYESPISKDLSNLSVSGQVHTQGECTAGTYPYANCVNGPSYEATCVPGSNVDTAKPLCSFGGYVNTPTCNTGASAATICISGAHQNV